MAEFLSLGYALSCAKYFATKREALAWEREQLNKVTADLDMTFGSFVETYTVDMKNPCSQLWRLGFLSTHKI